MEYLFAEFMAFGMLLPFLTAFGLVMFYLIDGEHGGIATFATLVCVAALQWGFGVDMIGAVKAHPMSLLEWAAAYLVVGTIWGVVKWWFYVRKQRRGYDVVRATLLVRLGLPATGPDGFPTPIPVANKDEFQRMLWSPPNGGERVEVKPDPTNHKAQIYLWMAYFPWSLTWTLINDPVKRAFDEAYAQVANMLRRISASAFAGTDGDLPK